MPLPPRAWNLYSSISVLLPYPFSVIVKTSVFSRTIVASTTLSPLSKLIDFTPIDERPVSRISCSWNLIHLPPVDAMIISLSPSVCIAPISSSPSCNLIAILPLLWILSNSARSVFLIKPFLVASTKYPILPVASGKMAFILSPSAKFNKLTIALPLAVFEPSGII